MRALIKILCATYSVLSVNFTTHAATNAPEKISQQSRTQNTTEWVSLYEGKEKYFQDSLRADIYKQCLGLGIPVKLEESQILVNRRDRPIIKKTISQIFKSSAR